MDSRLPNSYGSRDDVDVLISGMARIFTAAPGLVKLMNGEPWASTGLPDVYQMTESRLESLRASEPPPKVAIV
jgi:hypothetical protein